jgi:hypothetical protein
MDGAGAASCFYSGLGSNRRPVSVGQLFLEPEQARLHKRAATEVDRIRVAGCRWLCAECRGRRGRHERQEPWATTPSSLTPALRRGGTRERREHGGWPPTGPWQFLSIENF